MSLPRPIRPYQFQTDIIWWGGHFKSISLFLAALSHEIVFQLKNEINTILQRMIVIDL